MLILMNVQFLGDDALAEIYDTTDDSSEVINLCLLSQKMHEYSPLIVKGLSVITPKTNTSNLSYTEIYLGLVIRIDKGQDAYAKFCMRKNKERGV